MSKWKRRYRECERLLGNKAYALRASESHVSDLAATIAHIRQVARETPQPTIDANHHICVYCEHDTHGLHAPGCAWNELLKAIGVANQWTAG